MTTDNRTTTQAHTRLAQLISRVEGISERITDLLEWQHNRHRPVEAAYLAEVLAETGQSLDAAVRTARS